MLPPAPSAPAGRLGLARLLPDALLPAEASDSVERSRTADAGGGLATSAWQAVASLTGRRDGPALIGHAGIPALLDDLVGLLPPAVGASVARIGGATGLLAERAAIAGFERNGTTSVGGRCRLLRVGDAWIALSLVRDEDLALLPAWLGIEPSTTADPWVGIVGALRSRSAAEVVVAGAELGLAVSRLGEVTEPGPKPPDGRTAAVDAIARSDRQGPRVGLTGCRVLDLSSLWAGPLCAHLLGLAGAEVVKVESVHRPDGARRGPKAFYDLLHAGHASVALDLRTPEGRQHLRRLIATCDVVIEASRPRALRQLGVVAEEVLGDIGAGPAVWVSLTAYGRSERDEHRIGYGDDTAIAGGLVAWDHVAEDAEPSPVFLGDAIADPLTGITAAAAVGQALRAGGRWMLDIPLARVAAAFTDRPGAGASPAWPVQAGCVEAERRTVAASIGHLQARTPAGVAGRLGADNHRYGVA